MKKKQRGAVNKQRVQEWWRKNYWEKAADDFADRSAVIDTIEKFDRWVRRQK